MPSRPRGLPALPCIAFLVAAPLALLAQVPASPAAPNVPAQAAPGSGPEGLEAYLAENEAEPRLAEHKDSPEALGLKLSALALINKERAAAGSPPIALDILASRVANRHALESARAGYTGHWNLAGEKPYHRWAAAGGRDHVSENAGGLDSSGPLNPAGIPGFIGRLHGSFMAERPPSDGHRRNVLEKGHTQVGLGYALEGGRFHYYEEYLDRYFELIEGPERIAAGELASWRFLPKAGYQVYAIIVYWEAFPRPMTPAQLEASGSCPDYTNRTILSLWPRDFAAAEDGSVSFSASWIERGSYYVQVYLDTQAPPRSGRFSTVGRIQGSGLVVRVE